MTDIKKIHSDHKQALKTLKETESAREKAEKAYDKVYEKFIKQFEKENAEIVSDLEAATKAADEAKERVAELRNQASQYLTGVQRPEAPNGYGQRRVTDFDFLDTTRLKKILLDTSPSLVMLDEKQIKKIVQDNVIKGEVYTLPLWITELFGGEVDVFYNWQPSISDKTLEKDDS